MHLAAQPEESAEAHDQRTPARRIDTRARAVAHQQLFVDVQLHDMYLENVGVHVLAEGAEIMDDSLHVHRTLAHARWRYRFRLHRSESRNAKFVRFIAIAPLTLPLRHRILGGGKCEAVDKRD